MGASGDCLSGADSSRSRATLIAQVPSPMQLGFERPALVPCHVGESENIPAFQRWVGWSCGISPVGTAEQWPPLPSPRDLRPLARDPSIETPGSFQSSFRDEGVQSLVPLGFQPALRGGVSCALHFRSTCAKARAPAPANSLFRTATSGEKSAADTLSFRRCSLRKARRMRTIANTV